MKRSKMKKLADCMSPLSWLFVILAVTPGIVILLRPSLPELLTLAVLEGLAALAFMRFEAKLFQRFYPESVFYFNGVSDEQARKLPKQERIRLLQSLFEFPERRAKHCYRVSFIKAIPALLLIVFGWRHPEHGNLSQATIALLLSAISWVYFRRMVLLDSHSFISQMIARMHEVADFSEAFDQSEVQYQRLRLSQQEYCFFAFLVVFTVALQSTLILSGSYGSGGQLTAYVVLVGAVGLVLFSRAWFLGRIYVTEGLSEIYSRLKQVDRTPEHALPLNTLPLLAIFAQTLNRLTRRIGEHEKELSALVLRQAEKSRFRYLGEMTALLAHDLSGPLHVAQFSASQLSESPDMPADKRDRYLHHLVSSLSRAVELTTSLRSRVRNPESESRHARFRDAHDNVLNLLQTQIGLGEFVPVKFTLDPTMDQLVLEIPRVDLIHVLDNLYRNAFENLTEKSIQHPEIRIRVQSTTEPSAAVEILIHDNGSGLPARDFERLTTFRCDDGPQAPPRTEYDTSGLGLRLTRRLVEINGGDLSIVDHAESGTLLRLRLKRYAQPVSGTASSIPVVIIHHATTPVNRSKEALFD